MFIELRFTVTEIVWCGSQRPIRLRLVVTHTNDKSYALEIFESQIQRRHELSTKLGVAVGETIPS